MASRHLIHFAMVHEEFAKTGDIIKGILPLFTPILSGKEGEIFSPDKFCKATKELYGIEMHPFVAEDLASKFAEEGLLIKKNTPKHKQEYTINSIPKANTEQVDQDINFIFRNFERKAKDFLEKSSIKTENIKHCSKWVFVQDVNCCDEFKILKFQISRKCSNTR